MRGRQPPRETDSHGVKIHYRCPACSSTRMYFHSSYPGESYTRILKANRCMDCGWENPDVVKDLVK